MKGAIFLQNSNNCNFSILKREKLRLFKEDKPEIFTYRVNFYIIKIFQSFYIN